MVNTDGASELEFFVLVARPGSLAATARRLGLRETLPAVHVAVGRFVRLLPQPQAPGGAHAGVHRFSRRAFPAVGGRVCAGMEMPPDALAEEIHTR